MLNIISLSALSNRVSGPKKVVENLIKGLDKLHYPYVINKRLDACKRLWIHDDKFALRHLSKLDPEIKVIVGPNLFILPRNIPKNLDLSHVVYLQPSEWVKQMWLDFGFKECPIEVWPTGIDLDVFKLRQNKSKDYILIYFKQRFDYELKAAINALNQKKLPFKIINYGHYKQKEYLKLLNNCRYLIWIGRQESQGIALQEATVCNAPVLVFDVSYLGHWIPREYEKTIFTGEEEKYIGRVTSAPYFNSSCGIKIKKIDQLAKAISYMEDNWREFRPREYIMKNLSLEKQAKDFLKIYEKYWGLNYIKGFSETILRGGNYRCNFLYRFLFIIWNFIKRNKKISKYIKKLWEISQ